jgi:transglutaminase-like putative cysteine protease
MSGEQEMVGADTDALVKRWHRCSWLVAGALALAAAGVTGFQLDLRRRPATEAHLARAERCAVRGELRADFDWLRTRAAEPTARVVDWLDAVELAQLQRRQFYPALSEELFRECVLEPEVGGTGGVEVRRPLWTYFAPRVRKESEVPAAAAIVARELRTRVTPVDGLAAANLARAWASGRSNPADWERLYVAALRACGIAARLTPQARAEVWWGGQWSEAPRPLAGQTHE